MSIFAIVSIVFCLKQTLDLVVVVMVLNVTCVVFLDVSIDADGAVISVHLSSCSLVE